MNLLQVGSAARSAPANRVVASRFRRGARLLLRSTLGAGRRGVEPLAPLRIAKGSRRGQLPGRRMSPDEFRATAKGAPPEGLSGALQALWHDARGDLDSAHEAAQRADTPQGAWVHAYLHRKQGDIANAAYWYRRAGRPPAACAPEEEWVRIAGELLGAGRGPLSRA